MVHSANYDPDLDLSGKKVAVIGNGSSGIQVTSAVQKVAAKMSVYMRNPTWITASLGSKFVPDGKQMAFSEEQKLQWAKNPEEYL
jgi:cation diffusion facilitator CzcD-associated flavoprotein CzcO